MRWPFSKKTTLSVLAAIILCAGLIYTLFWLFVAGQIKTGITNYIADTNRADLVISGPRPELTGFPFTPKATLSPRISYEAYIFNIPSMEIKSWFLNGQPLDITLSEGISYATNVTTPDASGIPLVHFAQLSVMIPDTLPPTTTAEDLTAWQKADGRIEITKLDLRYKGLEVTGTGEIALDQALQPDGTLQVKIYGAQTMLAEAMQKGWLQGGQLMIARSLLQSMTKTEEDGTSYIDLPMRIANNLFYLGHMPVGAFPMIVWPYKSDMGNDIILSPRPE